MVTEFRKEVKKRIQDLSRKGGYVLASVHNIQRDVPPENIVAMFEAGLKFGEINYKISRNCLTVRI